MTNFGGATVERVSREQVLLWSPVLLGALLALLTGVALVVPAVQQLQKNQQQLDDLKDQEARLPLLRDQLLKQKENLDQARQRERQILQLIAGSGDISTFMAQLGKEALLSGVQLDSYEPVTTAAGTPAPAPATPAAKPATPPAKTDGTPAAPPAPADPLVASGLVKTNLLITARGSGPQLLDFLRRLERLSLLVVQSDLALKFEAGAAEGSGIRASPGSTTLKLNLSLYSKPANGAGATAMARS